MPGLRLKTKLVFAITAMVVAIVATLSTLYVSEVVHQRIQQAYNDGDFIAHEIFSVARDALESDLSDRRIDLNDPTQVENAVEEVLQTDAGVNSLLESIVGYSPNIYDAAITNSQGRALLHTGESFSGKVVDRREDFLSLVQGGTWKQLKAIYGPSHVYDVRVPLVRTNGTPFGEVRVGLSTVLLKSDVQAPLNRALLFSGIAILACLVLAAALSNVALRPLAAISRRLDLISAGELETLETSSPRSDEYGTVSHKIDRLGRQMRDVKEVFSALKENLDQMMANLQDGVMLFTSDFRAVLVSASAEHFIGKPRAEMLGCHLTEIFSQETRLGHTLLDAFENRQAVKEEIEAENGHRLEIALDFIEERGERIGALLTLRDAESVHRIEDEIELSRRLAAIGRLTSGVAHEVKNPINAIVVHLEVLRQKLHEADPDTRRHMDVIGSEIKRLDRVVQTLVDFTRPVEPRLTESDLRRVIDDVVLLASPEAAQRQVRIQLEVAPDPLPVRIDMDLLKQAVLNIVINGVQAMPEGGSLFITARRDRENAVLSVRDEGPGIPADVRDKIFNLYFTTKKGGSGIGLAVAYRILQLHQGALEFHSVEGQGTTFDLRLPLLEHEAVDEPARVIPASDQPVTTQ